MSTTPNMILWNGLPALVYDNENTLVVFSNIDDSLVFANFSIDEKDNIEIYNDLQEQGFFACTKKNSCEYLADEYTLILSLTERCNSLCRYCFLDAQASGKTMTVELLHKSIDKAVEIAHNRPINIAAFGGEPTVAIDLLKEMIAYTKSNVGIPYRFSITTNGIFGKEVLKILIDNNFEISLSMDGLPVYQNYQRPLLNGLESYSCVESNLKALIKSGCTLKVRCTITKASVNSMDAIVEHLGQLGVKRIHFEPVTEGGRGAALDDMLGPPQSRDFSRNLIKAIKKGAELDVDVICFPYMNMMIAPVVFCDGNISNRLVVSPAGVMSSCVEVQSKEHELYKSLGVGEFDCEKKELVIKYNSRREAQRGYTFVEANETNCMMCPVKFFCGGGCPTRNYRGTGNSNTVDRYRCDIIKNVMPYVLSKFYENSKEV